MELSERELGILIVSMQIRRHNLTAERSDEHLAEHDRLAERILVEAETRNLSSIGLQSPKPGRRIELKHTGTSGRFDAVISQGEDSVSVVCGWEMIDREPLRLIMELDERLDWYVARGSAKGLHLL